jgi:hypothetical protein
MKKDICHRIVVLLFVSAMLAGCASPVIMTSNDVPTLKGKWVGKTVFGSFGSAQVGGEILTEMEIYNDILPIEGKITFLTLPRRVWDDLPQGIKGGPTGQGAVIPFKNGKLSDKGFFKLISGENTLTLNLYNEGGKLKLEGLVLLVSATDRYFMQGDVVLDKK